MPEPHPQFPPQFQPPAQVQDRAKTLFTSSEVSSNVTSIPLTFKSATKFSNAFESTLFFIIHKVINIKLYACLQSQYIHFFIYVKSSRIFVHKKYNTYCA